LPVEANDREGDHAAVGDWGERFASHRRSSQGSIIPGSASLAHGFLSIIGLDLRDREEKGVRVKASRGGAVTYPTAAELWTGGHTREVLMASMLGLVLAAR
jgi:hypothetical protein